MRPAELPLDCALCGRPATYCDSVPDPNVPGLHSGEPGYRLTALCWAHAVERRGVATARVEPVLRCESQGLARLDRNRAGGDVVCDTCGRKFYDHPKDADYPFLKVLCDGSAVKL
jgi:endogenous inhibitor of DNA gyrase (YacG/DUF329 family)